MKKIKDFNLFARLLVVIIIIDSLWIGVIARSFYKDQIGANLRDGFLFWPALSVWALIILGMVIFVLPISKTPKSTVFNGAMYGLILYGVYDLTNYAVLSTWTLELTIIDIIWGTILCSFISWIGAKIRE